MVDLVEDNVDLNLPGTPHPGELHAQVALGKEAGGSFSKVVP